jgi:hypothetical protein
MKQNPQVSVRVAHPAGTGSGSVPMSQAGDSLTLVKSTSSGTVAATAIRLGGNGFSDAEGSWRDA